MIPGVWPVIKGTDINMYSQQTVEAKCDPATNSQEIQNAGHPKIWQDLGPTWLRHGVYE